MNELFLTKSGYCHCVQCKKIFWLDKYKKDAAVEEDSDSILKTGMEVGELAKGLFGDYYDIPFNEDISVRIEQTRKLAKKGNVIAEASFSYNNNFCSVDILKNDDDGVEIYEVKSSTKIKDIYLDDISY